MVGEKRRGMKWKFRSIGEQVWLQEALQVGRGSRGKSFALPGMDVAVPFASPAELRCYHTKLVLGLLPDYCSGPFLFTQPFPSCLS